VGTRPFYLDDRGWGMDQAYMLIERASPKANPSDRELAAMKLTRDQALGIHARLEAYHDQVLRSMGGGSYRVVLRRDATTHMEFTDLPFLSAHDKMDSERRARILTVIESYTRAFFDKSLRSKDSPLLERNADAEFVERVERFKPALAPCPRVVR
jgi:hypothetical protein